MLDRVTTGDHAAINDLMPLVYDELRSLAGRYLRDERSGHTLQATALVHEAYMRLVNGADRTWVNRAHFFATAATAIRRILIEHARRRGRLKRGGDARRVPLEGTAVAIEDDERLLELDEALNRLAEVDPRKARVVELRFFAGLMADEAAAVLGVSTVTVARDWRMARAWIRSQLEEGRPDGN